jgi:hypothetical protein
MGRSLRSVLALILTAASAPAAAQSIAMVDEEAGLAWRAPAGCPDADSVRTRIEQRLERSLDDVALAIEVDVALTAGLYVARIDLRAMTVANDVRTLRSKRCTELADAVAVIVTRVASEAFARKQVAAREDLQKQFIVEPSAPPDKPRLWSVGARLSAVSGIGIIPKVGGAAELAVVVRRADFLAELAGTRWLDSFAQLHDGAPAVIDVLLDTAAARAGWRPRHLPLRVWGAVEMGMMDGVSTEVPGEQFDSGRWIAAGVGFGVAWQMNKWLRLVGTNETMLAIDRMRFKTGSGMIVYAPSPMSFRAAVGLEIGWQ